MYLIDCVKTYLSLKGSQVLEAIAAWLADLLNVPSRGVENIAYGPAQLQVVGGIPKHTLKISVEGEN